MTEIPQFPYLNCYALHISMFHHQLSSYTHAHTSLVIFELKHAWRVDNKLEMQLSQLPLLLL